MITYTITIEELPNGSIHMQRTSPPGNATPREIAYAEHIKARLTELGQQIMAHAGRGISQQQTKSRAPGSINAEWLEFVGMAYGRVLIDPQLRELRQAFFAGAFSMFNAMQVLSCTETEAVAIARIEKLKTEIEIELRPKPAGR